MAKCFDSLEPFYPALAAGEIKPGMVLIFRYQGPKGAPGMPEVSDIIAVEMKALRNVFDPRCLGRREQSQALASPTRPP